MLCTLCTLGTTPSLSYDSIPRRRELENMKSMSRFITVVVLAVGLLASARVGAQGTNVTGEWLFNVTTDQGGGTPTITFKQDGEKVTGTYEGRYGKSNLEGTVKDNQVEFTVTMVAEGTEVTGAFAGTYDNDRMTGQVEYEGAGEGTWSAVRVAVKK